MKKMKEKKKISKFNQHLFKFIQKYDKNLKIY